VAAALAVPLTTLAHEGAHAIVANARGFSEVRLHALHVSYQAPAATPADRVAVAAAGPVTTTLLVLIGGLWLRYLPRSVTAAALVSTAPLRSFASLLFIVTWPFGAVVQPSDEHLLAKLLGLPLPVFALGSLSVLGLALAALVATARTRVPDVARALWVGTGVGAGVGWLLQLTLVPRWLP
jgi:hypothetical protein